MRVSFSTSSLLIPGVVFASAYHLCDLIGLLLSWDYFLRLLSIIWVKVCDMDWLHPVVQEGVWPLFIPEIGYTASQQNDVCIHTDTEVSTENAPTIILVIFFQNQNIFHKYAKQLVKFTDICTELPVHFSSVHKINSVEHVFGDSSMYNRACYRGSCVKCYATKHTQISSQNFVNVTNTALTCLIFFLHKNIPNAYTLSVNVFSETILISQAH